MAADIYRNPAGSIVDAQPQRVVIFARKEDSRPEGLFGWLDLPCNKVIVKLGSQLLVLIRGFSLL